MHRVVAVAPDQLVERLVAERVEGRAVPVDAPRGSRTQTGWVTQSRMALNDAAASTSRTGRCVFAWLRLVTPSLLSDDRTLSTASGAEKASI